jgi:hypothetical protein
MIIQRCKVIRVKSTALKLVVVGLVLLLAFTGIFVSGFHDPEPDGVEIGVVGHSPAAAPHGFDDHAYPSERAAREALLDADVHGVLVQDRDAATVLVTGAYGTPPTQAIVAALRGVARHPVRVRDLEPLPPHDSHGLSVLFTVLGTVVPSLIFGALLSIAGRGLPPRARWGALALFAALAGVMVAFSVDTLVGALTGHFWGVAGVTSLLAVAVASLSFGLGRLAGPPGVAAAALLLVLIGQSSAGGAVTYELQPGFHHALSQLFPNGAAITALRNTVYFGGAHTTSALLVLCAWAAAGIALALLATNERSDRHEGISGWSDRRARAAPDPGAHGARA